MEALLPALGLGIIRPLFVIAPLPLAGTKPLPLALQASLALALAVYVMPRVGKLPRDLDPAAMMLTTVSEALTGLAIGLALSLAIAGARLAGELIGTAMGIGFSSLIDPEHGVAVPTIGQFLSLTAVAVFMALDGPVVVVRIVLESYIAAPFGDAFALANIPVLTGAMSAMFAAALGLALPMLVATLMAQFALATLARLAPQLNLFAVGFPATLIVGLIVFALAFPAMGGAMVRLWQAGFATAARVAGIA